MGSNGGGRVDTFLRVAVVALGAPIAVAVVGVLLAYGPFPYWVDVILTLVSFLLVAVLAARIARRFAGYAVGVGLGITWFATALETSIKVPKSRLSSIIVIVCTIAATALAFWLGNKRDKKRESQAYWVRS